MSGLSDERRLLAVDPSLTCSGWAMFLQSSKELIAVGIIKPASPKAATSLRLRSIQEQVSKIITDAELGDGDLLICEAPTTMRDPRAALVVEQVRGIFETVARGRDVKVPGRINPRSVQTEIMGLHGRQLSRAVVKETAVRVVKSLYSEALGRLGFSTEEAHLKRRQDIVDAILVGALALTRIESANRLGTTIDSFFTAKRKVRYRKIDGAIISDKVRYC